MRIGLSLFQWTQNSGALGVGFSNLRELSRNRLSVEADPNNRFLQAEFFWKLLYRELAGEFVEPEMTVLSERSPASCLIRNATRKYAKAENAAPVPFVPAAIATKGCASDLEIPGSYRMQAIARSFKFGEKPTARVRIWVGRKGWLIRRGMDECAVE